MSLSKQDIMNIAEAVSKSLVSTLEQRGILDNIPARTPLNKKSAYAKTEALLYNYCGFKRLVEDKQREIKDIRTYGVPTQCGTIGDRVQTSTVPQLRTVDETVEATVLVIQRSINKAMYAIRLVEDSLKSFGHDPYCCIIRMLYFDGMTQEDIANELKCTQANVSYHKNRLVKAISMRIFTDQFVEEMTN